MKPLLKTKRLRISPMTDDALRALRERETDPENKKAYGDMLHDSMKHPAQRMWYTAWQITRKDGAMVGDLCFKGPPLSGEVEIGYGIFPDAQGLGYATEAASAAMDWAFSQTGVYFVTAETEPNNQKSQRVLQKLGFKHYGEGVEGPRFEKEKPVSNWLMIYLPLGLAVGVSLGAASANTGLYTGIGMCIGTALGIALDAQEKAALEKIRAQRTAERGSQPPA